MLTKKRQSNGFAVHPLRWRPEWGEPAIMFREVDEETQALVDAAHDLLAACKAQYNAIQKMLVLLGDHELLPPVPDKSVYDAITLGQTAIEQAKP